MPVFRSIDPTVISRQDFASNPVRTLTCSAGFTFHVNNINNIATEFDVNRSNEKGVTIARGCEHQARKDLAQLLEGKKFLIDRSGRELPTAIGSFEDETLQVVNSFNPDSNNERFHVNPMGTVYEAIKFKLFFKSLIQHFRLLYTNDRDDDLMTVVVDPDSKAGDAFIEALFRSGAEDRDINISFTEITNLPVGV